VTPLVPTARRLAGDRDAGETSKLTFLLPLQPGEISPGLAARMAATFQRYSGGRLLLEVESDEFVGAQRTFTSSRAHRRRWRNRSPRLAPHDGTTMVVHSGGAARLEVYPNVWAGVGLVPGGANLALVGNHAEVANRIEEYQAAGVDEFLPHAR
jgi:alkanesulfonate monooxygenase SsuD/methylene tetrahydromethanopterin reductase-like flavin-dependent oxidoreductase (luciferase family)